MLEKGQAIFGRHDHTVVWWDKEGYNNNLFTFIIIKLFLILI